MKLLLSALAAALLTGPFLNADSRHIRPAASLDPSLAPRSRPVFLILFSEDSSQPATQLMEAGLTDGTATAGVENSPVLYFEYLDATRFENASLREAFLRFLRDKYRNQRLDLVIPISQTAIQFAADVHDDLWPDLPILFSSTHSTTVDPASVLPAANGLVFELSQGAVLSTVLTVLPETRHIAYVWGTTALERDRSVGLHEAVQKAGREPIDLTGLPVADLLAAVGRLPEQTVIEIAGPLLDAAGQMNPAYALCELIASRANVPAFVPSMQFLGSGVIGGRMRDFHEMGRLLGERALTIKPKDRGRVESIPMEQFTKVAFDARALERWRIPESRLPANSTVEFRTPSLWRDYRREVLATAGAVMFQMLLIVGLLYERRQRLAAERENRRSLALTARIDRLSAMTELSGSIAHELSQPLNSILHNASAGEMLLSSNRAAPDQLKEILSDIRTEDIRASQIVQRHRAMFKHREMESRRVDLNAVVQECLEIVSHDAARRDVRMDVDLSRSSREVLGDRVLLQQVVLNLMLNGMDAMAGTSVDRRLTVRTALTKEAMEVSVSDSGTGISPEVIHRLFEPFVTTKADGMGIGLAISRSIVEAHGGVITARNNPNGGATFVFTVPCVRT